MLWYGKPVAEKLEEEVRTYVQNQGRTDKYVSIIMLGTDHPGAAYVSSKQKFAERIGMSVKIFGNEDTKLTEVDIIEIIQKCNNDEQCFGIMLQLPLPAHLMYMQQRILDAIDRRKDIDALGTLHQKYLRLLPATPVAVLQMINFYEYDVQGKNIAMIGNSNLIGRPLAFALEYKGALVRVFTIESDQEEMKTYCRESADMIISATGHIHLVTEEFVRDDKSQVVIDVGRGYKDGKAVGDVEREKIEKRVAAVTPVPGGVGPVTVASLFANIISLHENAEAFSSLLKE